ncbi:hypothetical protein V8C34DRAFT_300466 [Trichoderma compactum]
MDHNNQPSDANGSWDFFLELEPLTHVLNPIWTGDTTPAGTTAQVPSVDDAPEPTSDFFDNAMAVHDQAREVNASMENDNGSGHEAGDFNAYGNATGEIGRDPEEVDYIRTLTSTEEQQPQEQSVAPDVDYIRTLTSTEEQQPQEQSVAPDVDSAFPVQHQVYQQQQASANPFPEPTLYAVWDNLALVKGNLHEVYARTCDFVNTINMMVGQGMFSRQQALDMFEVNHGLHDQLKAWVRDGKKDPDAKIVKEQQPAHFDSMNWNFRFDTLFLRAMTASRDFTKALRGLPHEWIFGKGPALMPEPLRQVIVECHTVALNTFYALLSIMEHDGNLLPYRFTESFDFDVMSITDQETNNAGEIRYVMEKCMERICTHILYVHQLLRDLPRNPILPELKKVQPIANDQLQPLLQLQQQAMQGFPLLMVHPCVAGPDTGNEQISLLERLVLRQLNFILQRVPRK